METIKDIEQMTSDEARAAGRWSEWWMTINKALIREQSKDNMFDHSYPTRC